MLRPEPLPLSIQSDHHHRPATALDQARGDDPDHARVPALPGKHVCRPLAKLRHLRFGLEADALLDLSWLVVGAVELASDLLRPLRVRCQDQLQARIRPIKPPGSVQARRQRKAQRALVDLALSTPATDISARRPGFVVAASARRPDARACDSRPSTA